MTILRALFLLSVVIWPSYSKDTSSLRYSNRKDAKQEQIPVVQSMDKICAVSKTTATLQLVNNPMFNKETSPIATKLFHQLHNLQADLVRYATWFPYPHMAVAELEPPNGTHTFWNFSKEFVQLLNDTFQAVTSNDNKRVVLSLSTQPTWMFNTSDWSYPDDHNQVAWHYSRGNFVENHTVPLVAGYYARLASWVVRGHFEDEYGVRVDGGPAWGKAVTHWEVFNEPEAEHRLSWSEYTALYDSIVREIRKSTPNHKMTFVGMALINHNEWDWWNGFLNLTNHAADVRDAVANGVASFHFYAQISSRTNVSTYVETFPQVTKFLEEVDQILQIRNALSPNTQLAVNEAGAMAPDDNSETADPLPPVYFNMAAAVILVLLSELSVKGIDVMGMSQLSGFPAGTWNIADAQYPSVSMTNWTTGEGNPRYWSLKLFNHFFGPGDKILETNHMGIQDDAVYVQARITAKDHLHAWIVVNPTLERQEVKLVHPQPHKDALICLVDESTHDGPWKEIAIDDVGPSVTLSLDRFGIAVVILYKDTAVAR